ncbi:MAG TPA: quinolinate synthase NadA [Candidatus Polarisedimenticolaceae bacterium]|nr:quinolinate synthase NadA [Candidatus Polarisedimenticolaceae bacterium]
MSTREEVAERYLTVSHAVPPIEWPVYVEDVGAILDLKRRRSAKILAHNYQDPVIYHGLADATGDSLAFAERARALESEVLVVCGVSFMAETVKLLNPHRTILIPEPDAGCSLAESITPEDVRRLRSQWPGVPAVCYVNTSAAVKAECDVCCTSANAVEVARSFGSQRVLFLPDRHLARYVAAETGLDVIPYDGSCEVHERFTAEDIRELREFFPDVVVLAHPECVTEVLAEADYVGSTSGMIRRLRARPPACAALITECTMSANVAAELPGIKLVRPCNICPHMHRTTVASVRRSLETMTHEIVIDPEVARRARRSIERMLEIGRGRTG